MPPHALVILLLLFVGCTTRSVRPIDATEHPVSLVCIEENPRAKVGDFLGVIEDRFLFHGIETQVYAGEVPSHCEYTLNYTAHRRWDVVSYMSHAELRLKKDGRMIGMVTYSHSGGFGFNKFASTRSKLTPLIDELLVE